MASRYEAPRGREKRSVLKHVSISEPSRNEVAAAKIIFILQCAANQNSNQQRDNRVQFREHGQNHGAAEKVVAVADTVDTVGANLGLAEGGKPADKT